MSANKDKITDAVVKSLPVPAKGNRITYDAEVKGFGVRVTAAGARSFVLNYRTKAGRERRYTIGSFPEWKATAARIEAAELKKRVDRGEDPMADVEADREAPTVADLCTRYTDEHLPKKRENSRVSDEANIRLYILPELKHRKVAEVTFSDIDGLHRKVTKDGKPIAANRVVALCSKMFALAIRWGWRTDNPAKGIERNPETKRNRYATGDELGRLTEALAAHDDQQAANAIRLLLLTGARKGEVLGARWDQLDLAAGVWTKPGATTKQKTDHRVPLSAPTRQLLVEMRAEAEKQAQKKGREVSDYVLPGRGGVGHREDIKNDWRVLRKVAGLGDVRIHDLRHTYASVLASAGLSLPIIGALLGHTNPATTQRYAHLFDDPLRAATERVGAVVMPTAPKAEVVPIKGGA
ncbi:Integrase [Rhodovulum sp. PH10]|uniref:tyrosine-type recombinase/integrase n=1 Tax=Rhodovulum sp. PH10 TaxID=1187851 RepID=UPI00027C2B50|nr:site-specific integrase [Rhodovulum sp. PH10]EJW11723.1 Integrase [Rhodovulum sp. PH10]